MLRAFLLTVWLLLTAWLVIWVGEGLFGVDQRVSILPFGDSRTAPVLIGVAWGILLTIGGAAAGPRRRRIPEAAAEVAVGRIVQASPTGTSINDVPQYDLFLRVTPRDGDDFVAQLRMLVPAADAGAVRVGTAVPVRYRQGDHDAVELADLADPVVRDAMLQWRIDRGLIDPSQVRARTTGTAAPASVLAVRPTGRRREGQVELELRVLVAPDGASPWEADTTVFVLPDAVPHLQVGAPVQAYHRPEDPQTVAVTLEQEASR